MLSALESRPRLKPDVRIVRREHDGQVHYVVKEPREQKYFRFGEVEVGLMRLMDGERTPAEIAHAARALGVRPPAGQVADFAQKLKRLGLVERTPAEQHLMLAERLRSQRKLRAGRRTKGSILRIRFSIGDPDELFDGIVARIRWFWSRPFILVSSVLFVAYAVILIARWNQFWSDAFALYTFSGFGIWDWVLLYGLILVIGIIHELGHGLTTKALGGSVHEIGGMLLYFSPALYCNTNDAWLFERRSHRLWVTFAGPWIELLIAAVGALVWVATEPGTLINQLGFLTTLVGGILSLLTNLNPLLPLDGYYALSDWLEIPNLRRRSFEYLGWLLKRHLLGIHAAEPPATPRERRVFISYGVLAFAYSLVVAVISLVWLILVIGRFLGPWLWLLILALVVTSLGRLSRRGKTLATAAARTWRAGFLGDRRIAIGLAAFVLVCLIILFLPWTFRAKGEFRVEAVPRAVVRAQTAGVLDRWEVSAGDTVVAGDPIAVLWNPGLHARWLALRAETARLELTRASAASRNDLVSASTAGARLEEKRVELAALEARHRNLLVRAPITGVVLGHDLEEEIGRALADGDSLVEIAGLRHRRARVRIPLKYAGEVSAGQRAKLKLLGRPDLKFVSTVKHVAPAAADGHLEAEVPLPDGQWRPAPGTTGIAKIETHRGTIAQAVVRALQRTFRIELWL